MRSSSPARRLAPLALLIGGALALAALVFLSIAVLQSQQRAEEDAISRFADRGELAAQLLAGVNQRSTTRQAADAQLMLSGEPTAAALQAWEGDADPVIPYSALYDANGQLLAVHPSGAEPATSDSGREALQQAIQGQTATSGVTETDLGSVIETFIPFPAGDDGLRVLLLALPTEFSAQLAAGSLEGAAGTPSGTAYLTDRTGTVIAAVGAAADDDDAKAMVAEAVRERRTEGSIGEQRLVVSPVADSALVVALTAPEQELTADLPSMLPPRLALAGFGLALLGVVWLSARALRDGRRLEAARITAEEASRAAAEANRAKTDFLSHMSHELRTPLNAIMGFAQLLALDELTEQQHESTDQIMKGGHRLLALINEVLDVSRVESGTLQLSLEPVLVGEVVRDSVELIRPLADDRGIHLRSDLTTETRDASVVADRRRVGQVLLNLLSNAVKYNVAGGAVTVTAQRTESDRIRIGVTDTGPGIPEDKAPLLFMPFERLGAEHSPVEGTGLGLTLSKKLIEAMDGSMEVETTVGQGTTFWVELRRADEPPPQPDAPSRDRPVEAMTRGKIVYIEDNVSNLRLIERLLAHRADLELIPAATATLGIELAQQHVPDLVLLDMHLPDLEGDVVLARLQHDPRTASIPVVILSADATPGQIERLRAAGAADYLTKPLDIPTFLAVVDRVIGAGDG